MCYVLGNVKKGWTCFSLSAKLFCLTACHETFTNVIIILCFIKFNDQATNLWHVGNDKSVTLSMFVIMTIIKGKVNKTKSATSVHRLIVALNSKPNVCTQSCTKKAETEWTL